jgi:uncharacterized protein with HEPN domain
MSRGEERRLADILEAIGRVRAYAPSEPEPLVGVRRDAILYNLVVIGEAVAHVSEKTRLLAPDIPWPKIVGLRNLLAHEYFRIDTAIVAAIVAEQLDPLEETTRRLLETP